MNAEHWQLVMDIVARIREQGPEASDELLQNLCRNDAMRAEVKRLLVADEKARQAGFLEPISLITQDDTTGLTGLSTASQGPDKFMPAGTTASLLAGVETIGGYPILAQLGQGGMGVVLQARDETLNRFVAIKIPRSEAVLQDRQRFLREARAAASLRHPNVCPIHEIGDHHGVPFLVMGYVAGQTLDAWCSQQSTDPRTAAGLVGIVARAVQHAHDNGVLHRDIKPSNVMIDDTSGSPILMDFGLAKEIAEETEMTATGQLMGTPAYMAPEQAAGGANRSDCRVDVYGLGALLYYLISGRPPFEGPMAAVLHQVQFVEPPSPRRFSPGLDRDLETICFKAMSKEVAARYASAGELADDLDRFCAGESILARREGILRKTRRTVYRRPWAVGGVLAGCLLLVLLAAVAHTAYRDRQQVGAVKVLTRRLDAALNSPDWTVHQLGQYDRQVQQLEQLAPGEGERYRGRIDRQLAQSIKESIATPRLDEEIVECVEANLNLLSSRDAATAAALRETWAIRLRDWQPVLILEAPFDNRDAVFTTGVRVEQDMLVAEAATDNIVWTRVDCSGNARMHVEFSRGWVQPRGLGIMLGADSERLSGDLGYRFLVKPVPRSNQPFEAVPGQPVKVRLAVKILRRNELLREGHIDVDDGPLRLLARRQLNRLTFQINDFPPFEFLDAFPVSSEGQRVFALQWPAGLAVRRMQGSEQELALAASPLERGDTFYRQGEFGLALEAFEVQAIDSSDSMFSQEARLKQALCLVKLRRESEAMPILERCAAGEPSRWSALARCQLMTLQLDQNEYESAFVNFEKLALDFRPEEIRPLIPARFNRAVLEKYQQDGSGVYLLAYSPERFANLNHAYTIQQYFGEEGPALDTTRLYLCRAHYLGGSPRTAWTLATELVNDHPVMTHENQDRWFEYWETYSWLTRMEGTPREALTAVNRCLNESGEYRAAHLPLLLERSRIHVALEQWSEAEQDLNEFLRLTPPKQLAYRHFSSAHLMLGCLYERRGDMQNARRIWLQGAPDRLPGFSWLQIRHVEALVNALLLAALTDSLTVEDIQHVSERLVKKLSNWLGNSFVEGLVTFLLRDLTAQNMATIVHRMDQRPDNRRYAHEIAFRSLPPAQLYRKGFGVLAVEAADVAVAGELTSEDVVLATELGDQIYLAYYRGALSKKQLLSLTLTWAGVNGFEGWQATSAELDVALRSLIAYGFGHRYTSLGRTSDALAFYRQAAREAEPDSQLLRMAQRAISELSADNEANMAE